MPARWRRKRMEQIEAKARPIFCLLTNMPETLFVLIAAAGLSSQLSD